MGILILSLFICITFNGIYATDAVSTGPSSCPADAKSAIYTLKRKIFCGYDREVRPVRERRTMTNVSIVTYPTSLTMDEAKNLLKIQQWGYWEWKDEFLNWTSSDFGNLTTIYVTTGEIWAPDIELFTSANLGEMGVQLGSATPCDLKHDGLVECWPLITNNAKCDADITLWPFDTQNCTLRMGSWTRREINISLSGAGISNETYTNSQIWELLHMTAELRTGVSGFDPDGTNGTYQTLIYSFLLKRHAGSDTIALIIPAILLAVLTLVAFWIEPGASERLCITCLNVVCHCIFLQYLGPSLPANGLDKCPLIVLFYRDSLLMTSLSLIVTLLVRRMEDASSLPPSWITLVVNGVLTTLPGQLLILSGVGVRSEPMKDEPAESIAASTESNRNIWRMFASVANFSVFLVYTLTLSILLLSFVV